VEKKIILLNLLTSSVSHELITPIRCIIAFMAEMLKGKLKREMRDRVVMIVSAAKLLLI
jgi:signal transduction histidine kinase